ncbi:MAG: ester cyclase [Candidatus Sulfotelmatobacter sp.]
MQKKCAFVLSLLVVAMTLPCQAQPASEQEKNKTVARTFFEEVLGQGKLEKYSESHTADFVGHSAERDFTLAEDLAAAREERKALPDMQFAVNHMVAEGDLVVVHWTVWGTNTQPGMGLPATGKPIKTSGMTLFRFREGKISEEWGVWSMLSVLKQVGLLCPPKGPTGQEPKVPTHDPTNP